MAGNGGKNATGAAWVAGVVCTLIVGYLLYVTTGFPAPLGASGTEIIVGLVCFGLVFLLLSRLVFPQFEKIYAERADRIEGGLARAEALQEEAAELKAQYEEQLAAARGEAALIRDEARAEGAEVRAALRAQAEADAAGVRTAAAAEIAEQRAAAELSLRGDLGSLSTQMAERILGTSLSATATRSVDDYLAEIDGARRN